MATKSKFPKMKPRIKKLWLEALRSGQYKQTEGRLTSTNGRGQHTFCCLGVLCNVAVEQGFGEWDGLAYMSDPNKKFCWEEIGLTEAVRTWAGIKPNLAGELPTEILVNMNDEDGKSFPEIADWIEVNL